MNILIVIFFASVFYILGAFISMELNPENWWIIGRVVYFLALLYIIFETIKDDKE